MSLRMHAIARPYARALFEITESKKSTEAVRKDLESLLGAVQGSSDFRRFLASPVVKDSDRKAVVAAVAQKLGVSKLTANFLQLLADKRRLNVIEEIVELFNREADAAAGVLRAEAFAPVKLSALQVNRLRTALEEMTGRKVVVADAVDPSLMGGLVVRMNGQIFDTTVKSQLDAIKQKVLRI